MPVVHGAHVGARRGRCSIFALQFLRCVPPANWWFRLRRRPLPWDSGRFRNLGARLPGKTKPVRSGRPVGHSVAWSAASVLRLLSGWSPCVFPVLAEAFVGGAEEIRTPDLRRAKAALSQLSYGPSRVKYEYATAFRPGAIRWCFAGRTQNRWWAILDSNQRPQSYQDCALTS